MESNGPNDPTCPIDPEVLAMQQEAYREQCEGLAEEAEGRAMAQMSGGYGPQPEPGPPSLAELRRAARIVKRIAQDMEDRLSGGTHDYGYWTTILEDVQKYIAYLKQETPPPAPPPDAPQAPSAAAAPSRRPGQSSRDPV